MRVLITGGAAGLPAGIAVALARDGYDVSFTYRPGGTPPDRTRRLIEETGRAAGAFPVDFLAAEDALIAALQTAVALPVQALIHGVGPMAVRRFERATTKDYHEMIDGNFRSAVFAAEAVLPSMRDSRYGRIVFFALNSSHNAGGIRGLALHAAAKAALVAFARSLALEEAHRGITVNVIEPGDLRDKTADRSEALRRTAANPRGRPGTWEDVADAARFFLDPSHDFVNGAVLAVTGGLIEPYERSAPNS